MTALASLQGSLNGWLDYFLVILGVMILAAIVIVFWAAVFAGKDQWQLNKAAEKIRHQNFPTLTPPFQPPPTPPIPGLTCEILRKGEKPRLQAEFEAAQKAVKESGISTDQADFWTSPEPKRRPIRRPRSGYTEFLSDVTTVTHVVKGTVKFTIAHNDTKQEQTHWMSPCDAERIGRQMIHAASMARGDWSDIDPEKEKKADAALTERGIVSRPVGRLE